MEGRFANRPYGVRVMHPEQESAASRQIRWDKTTKVVVVVLLIALIAAAIYAFRIVFIPLIIGAIVAYALTPLVGLLKRRLRLPHGLATGIVYLIGLAIIIPLLIVSAPWVIDRVLFVRDELIRFVAHLNTIEAIEVAGFELSMSELSSEVTTALRGVISRAAAESIGLLLNAAELLLLVIFTFLIAFYLTRDAERFVETFSGLVPLEYREDALRLLEEIDQVWSAFLRGQVTLAFVAGLILTAVSAALGLPQPILMGVLGGLMEFLPSVGHAIWLITASLLALISGSTTLPVSNFVFLLIVIGAHIVYTQFDLNFLIPRIIGREVHLHPMVVILGIIIGAEVGGVLGIVLAAPTIASLRVIGRYIYARLLDLDPFPMVGPPIMPPAERVRRAEEIAAARQATRRPRRSLERLRRQANRALRRERESE